MNLTFRLGDNCETFVYTFCLIIIFSEMYVKYVIFNFCFFPILPC